MKRITNGFVCCLFMMLSVGCGAAIHAVDSTDPYGTPPPVKVQDAKAYAPSPLPDRLILTWTGDPTRSQAVTWRTDTTIAVGLAEIAVAADNSSFAKVSRQLKAHTTRLDSDLSHAHYHSANQIRLSRR